MLVIAKNNRSALCVGRAAMFIMGDDGHSLSVGTDCPEWENGRPTAVINTEHPNFAKAGIIAIVLGSIIQLSSLIKSKNKKTYFKN